MGNVFPTEVRLHRKYDLKGSTHGRTAGAQSTLSLTSSSRYPTGDSCAGPLVPLCCIICSCHR